MTIETLMLSLMLYLQIPGAAPAVEVISDAHMMEVGQGTCRKKVPCWGLFHYADGKIYVREGLDIYSDFGKSVIVHELRHYQQTLTCGPLEKVPAWQETFWAHELATSAPRCWLEGEECWVEVRCTEFHIRKAR